MNTKEKIFTLLSEAEETLSGELISKELGISRVSVWKHVKGMVNAGIPITSSPKGYTLIPEDDNLKSLGFGPRSELIHYHTDVSSTMDEAVVLARNGCPDFTVVVAERQTKGRGRMERIWVSGDGGLYFTIVVRPDLPLDHAHLVNLAAGVEINRLLRSSYGIESWLKWPNDILVDKKKICGCLSQMHIEGEVIEYLSIGIGLNVNNATDHVEQAAISMKEILGHTVARKDILLQFIDRFEDRMQSFNPTTLIEEWKAYNDTIGREITIITRKNTFEGKAVDIDSQGGLIIENDTGEHETVIYGDCFYN